MSDFLPSSDIWWRYFIYGAFFHFLALTPLAKNDRQAEIVRLFGYAVAVIPVFLKEGFLASLWMVAFLYGCTLSFRYLISMFK